MEARLFVDMASSSQFALSPQLDLLISRLFGESHTFVYQTGAKPQTAGRCLNKKQAQLRNCLRFLNQEYTANRLPIVLCDPASLAPRIVVLHERSNNARNERFVPFVIAVLLPIKQSVTAHDPPHIFKPVTP